MSSCANLSYSLVSEAFLLETICVCLCLEMALVIIFTIILIPPLIQIKLLNIYFSVRDNSSLLAKYRHFKDYLDKQYMERVEEWVIHFRKTMPTGGDIKQLTLFSCMYTNPLLSLHRNLMSWSSLKAM